MVFKHALRASKINSKVAGIMHIKQMILTRTAAMRMIINDDKEDSGVG